MTSFLLLESGDKTLLEDGDDLLLEDGSAAVVVGTAQFASKRLRRRFRSKGFSR